MLKAIAIDDEPKALEIIKSHAQRVPSLILKEVFTDPFNALVYLNEHKIDLIFLDIHMPDISGLEFTKAIRKKNILVIFTTAYSEYALESYEVEALDYLLKPFDFTRFLASVCKAEERFKKLESFEREFFFVKSGNKQYKICFEDILFIKGDGNYVTFFTCGEKVMVRSSIKETLASLPSYLFVQIQRSYIIPLRKIDKIQGNHIHIGSHKIAIGAKYRAKFISLVESLNK